MGRRDEKVAKAKKPIFKKWWFWLIIVIVIAGAVGGGNKDKTKKADTEKTAKVETKESKTEKSSPKKSEKQVFGIGQDVTVGKVVYRVDSKEVADTVGNEYLNSTAKGKFLVLNVTVTNNGDKAVTVTDDFFKLYKGKTEFKADTTATMYANQAANGDSAAFFLQELNPESTLSGKVIFDVSEDTISDPSTQLQVQTGIWGTQTEKINLN
ncbi:MAG: DUF4352 domain-containing protein [Lactococcus sp.]|nr:DUF4352 domain-containing protein [Lactococcus sp.]MDN5402825.1 DUF4352 domain-containing protein [Lactococcus sp.]MDN5410113.1 DUF4352 domain-containing protein [Lactococcus sp.]MDN5411226.1 DUF4352 domain-containing protein [Lactococcus sp.]MDN5435778.1 DUF4352 domain-containing protein [Lactococcus sp.]MDN5460662.1 DUF4352 domain-containing protein [Lactococcus sp.]